MEGYNVFHRRYWPVLRRLPNPPSHVRTRLATLGRPSAEVWRRSHEFLDQLRVRWRV